MSEELELPEWVKTLIEKEKSDAYCKGQDDGIRWALEQAEKSVASLRFRFL